MFSSSIIPYRTLKNFGHKRQPASRITMIWHGFLTFCFIGMGLEWKKMGKLLFGDETQISPMDPIEKRNETP